MGKDALKLLMEESDEETRYRCLKCKDKKSILISDSEVILCDCVKSKMWEDIYRKSNIPQIYWNLSLSEWNEHEYWEGGVLSEEGKKRKRFAGNLVGKYTKSVGAISSGKYLIISDKYNNTKKIKNLFFSGGKNSGKTMLACIIAVSAVNKGLKVKFYNFLDLINTLSDYNTKSEQNEIAKDWLDCDVIIVDGISSDYNSQIVKGPFSLNLDRISNCRLNSGKPIVVTGKSGEDVENVIKITGSVFKSLIDTCLYVSLPSYSK